MAQQAKLEKSVALLTNNYNHSTNLIFFDDSKYWSQIPSDPILHKQFKITDFDSKNSIANNLDTFIKYSILNYIDNNNNDYYDFSNIINSIFTTIIINNANLRIKLPNYLSKGRLINMSIGTSIILKNINIYTQNNDPLYNNCYYKLTGGNAIAIIGNDNNYFIGAQGTLYTSETVPHIPPFTA